MLHRWGILLDSLKDTCCTIDRRVQEVLLRIRNVEMELQTRNISLNSNTSILYPSLSQLRKTHR